jgi:exodeoxyribonuclease III
VAAASEATIVCGDVNIAPADEDLFDEAYVGQTHVTGFERAALVELQGLGLHDVCAAGQASIFTFWDYRAGMFHRDLGMPLSARGGKRRVGVVE